MDFLSILGYTAMIVALPGSLILLAWWWNRADQRESD